MSALGSSVSGIYWHDWLLNLTNSHNLSSAFGLSWSKWIHFKCPRWSTCQQLRLGRNRLTSTKYALFLQKPREHKPNTGLHSNNIREIGGNYFSALMHTVGGCQSSTHITRVWWSGVENQNPNIFIWNQFRGSITLTVSKLINTPPPPRHLPAMAAVSNRKANQISSAVTDLTTLSKCSRKCPKVDFHTVVV